MTTRAMWPTPHCSWHLSRVEGWSDHLYFTTTAHLKDQLLAQVPDRSFPEAVLQGNLKADLRRDPRLFEERWATYVYGNPGPAPCALHRRPFRFWPAYIGTMSALCRRRLRHVHLRGYGRVDTQK